VFDADEKNSDDAQCGGLLGKSNEVMKKIKGNSGCETEQGVLP
jgi:hypothetical protein